MVHDKWMLSSYQLLIQPAARTHNYKPLGSFHVSAKQSLEAANMSKWKQLRQGNRRCVLIHPVGSKLKLTVCHSAIQTMRSVLLQRTAGPAYIGAAG